MREKREWDEARVQIEKALELDPLAHVAYNNLGWYYNPRGDRVRAIESFGKAIELGFTSAHWSLGVTYGLMKKFDDTKREFATFVKLCKDTVPFAQLDADVWTAYLMDDKETVERLLPELEAHFHDEGGPLVYHILSPAPRFELFCLYQVSSLGHCP